MRTFHYILCAISTALPLICGCATGGWVPFASGNDRPEKMVEVELAADRASPWGRKPAAIETQEPEPKSGWFSNLFGAKKPEKTASLPAAKKSTRMPLRSQRATGSTRDQGTRDYIDRELHDATADERLQLYQQLQGADPQMVQQVVRVWKMSRATQSQQRAAAAHETATARSERSRRTQTPVADGRDDETDPHAAENESQAGYLNTGMGTLDPWKPEDGTAPFANPQRNIGPHSNRTASRRRGEVAQTQYSDPNSQLNADNASPYDNSGRNYPTQNGSPTQPPGPAGYTRSWSLEPNAEQSTRANRPFNTQQFAGSTPWPPRGNVPAQPTGFQGSPSPSNSIPPYAVQQNPYENAGQVPPYGWQQQGLTGNSGPQRPLSANLRPELGNLVPGSFGADSQYQARNRSRPDFTATPPAGSMVRSSGGLTSDQVNNGIQTTNFHNQIGMEQNPNAQATAWNSQGAYAPQTGPQGNPVQRASWQMGLQQIISVAETQTAQLKAGTSDAERQAYIESHVYLRMLYLMAGQQERALQAIPGIDPADQEFWQQSFWGMSNYFDTRGMPRSSDRASQAASQLTAAVQHLQSKANLELRNVSFCQKITSYGNYERFGRDEFTPGQQVLLYGEVQNFLSEAVPSGQHRTVLRSVVEFYKPGPQGEMLDRIEFSPTEDLCRNYRRDYFHSYEFAIPAKLSIGPHVLKLTVEDQLSHRVATYTLNFTVHQ